MFTSLFPHLLKNSYGYHIFYNVTAISKIGDAYFLDILKSTQTF